MANFSTDPKNAREVWSHMQIALKEVMDHPMAYGRARGAHATFVLTDGKAVDIEYITTSVGGSKDTPWRVKIGDTVKHVSTAKLRKWFEANDINPDFVEVVWPGRLWDKVLWSWYRDYDSTLTKRAR